MWNNIWEESFLKKFFQSYIQTGKQMDRQKDDRQTDRQTNNTPTANIVAFLWMYFQVNANNPDSFVFFVNITSNGWNGLEAIIDQFPLWI